MRKMFTFTMSFTNKNKNRIPIFSQKTKKHNAFYNIIINNHDGKTVYKLLASLSLILPKKKKTLSMNFSIRMSMARPTQVQPMSCPHPTGFRQSWGQWAGSGPNFSPSNTGLGLCMTIWILLHRSWALLMACHPHYSDLFFLVAQYRTGQEWP